MKKLFAAILALATVLLTLSGCGTPDPTECSHDDGNGDGICDKCETAMPTQNITEDTPNADAPISSTSSAGLEFTLNSECSGYILTSFGSCTDKDVIIDKYNNLYVKEIAPFAFDGCKSMESVTIGTGVEEIGAGVFCHCTNLKEINVKEGNKKFYSSGGILYSNDKSLISYAIGKEDITFSIPDEITSISDCAFGTSVYLLSLTIPESVTRISTYAFSESGSIVEVIDKSGIVTEDFNGLDGAIVHNGESKLEYVGDFISITIDGASTIVGYRGDKDLTLGSVLNGYKIADGAFAYNSKIESVTIGYNGELTAAFLGCANLKSVVLSEGVSAVYANEFSECTGLVELTLPVSLSSIGYAAFADCKALELLIIPSGVGAISQNAFSGCEGLTIYCRSESKSEGWQDGWDSHVLNVAWGYNG